MNIIHHLCALNRSSHPKILSSAISFALLTAVAPHSSAQITLQGTEYLETFDGIGSGLPAGWSVRTGANSSSLGTAGTFVSSTADWGATNGAFKNFASADGLLNGNPLTGSETSTDQALVTDRAIGIRQTGSLGDPGAAFTLQLANTAGFGNFSLSFSAQTLDLETRTTTWTLQYGLGDTPSSFIDLATYTTASEFDATTINAAGAISGIADQNQTVWLRIVALTGSSGSGSRDTSAFDDFRLTYSASVAPQYWDLNGATTGLGGATGTWDSTSSNWSSSDTGAAATTTFNSASAAIFGGTAGTVQVAAGGVTANNGLRFTTSGYTVTGGKLTLGGAAPSISVANSGDSATISAEIAGTGFTKTGEGTLILTNQNNSYTGSTSIAAGVLEVSHDGQLGASEADINLLGGTLKATTAITFGVNRELTGTGSIDTAAGVTFNGPVNAAALTFTNTGTVVFGNDSQTVGNLTFAAGASDSAPLLNTGVNTLNLTGNLTTTHTSGVVRVDGTIDVGASNRTFTTSESDAPVDLLINAALSGGGRIQLAGPETSVIQLNGDNSAHTGGFRMNAGAPKVLLGHSNALGTGQLFLNGGTLQPLTDLTISTPISVGGNATISGDKSITFTGDISLFGTLAKTLTVDTAVVFEGNFGAEGSSTAGLTFAGNGSVALANAANGISGPLVVDGPSVSLNGILNVTDVAVQKGILNARGSLPMANLSVGDDLGDDDATFILGDTIGNLDVVNLTLASDATFKLQINSTAGTSDTLMIFGGATLGEGVAKVEITDLGTTVLPSGTEFTLIDNQGIFPVGGFFEGMPHLAQFTVGLNQFEIDYGGATEFEASDVVLRVIPEPGTAALLLTGLAIFGGFRRRRSA